MCMARREEGRRGNLSRNGCRSRKRLLLHQHRLAAGPSKGEVATASIEKRGEMASRSAIAAVVKYGGKYLALVMAA